MEVTSNPGDAMSLQFRGATELTIFGSTSANGATVQFQLDQQSSTVDLSMLNPQGQDLCFPIFTANGLSESDVHTLTATHSGIGESVHSQGPGIFGIARIIIQTSTGSSTPTSSPIPPASSGVAGLLASSTSQSTLNTSIPTPGLSAAKLPSGEHSKSNAGLVAGVVILLLALAALSVAFYIFWRKRNERIKAVTNVIALPPPRVDSIGDPDVLGQKEKWISHDEKEDIFSDRKVLPGTLPRALLRTRSLRQSLVSTTITIPPKSSSPPLPEKGNTSILTHEAGQVETPEEKLQEPHPVEKNIPEVGQQRSIEHTVVATPPVYAEFAPRITSAAQFPFPPPSFPPPTPPEKLPTSKNVPQVLKPGLPQIRLEIPNSNSEGKQRPVSTASWRTVGTPFTPYAGVVTFGTREVMRVEQPQFSWQAAGSLEKGQVLDSEGP